MLRAAPLPEAGRRGACTEPPRFDRDRAAHRCASTRRVDRLRLDGDRRVRRRRRDRRLLLPRDEHPAPGRTPDHRSDHRPGPCRAPDTSGDVAPARHRAGLGGLRRPRDRGAHQRRRCHQRLCAADRAGHRARRSGLGSVGRCDRARLHDHAALRPDDRQADRARRDAGGGHRPSSRRSRPAPPRWHRHQWRFPPLADRPSRVSNRPHHHALPRRDGASRRQRRAGGGCRRRLPRTRVRPMGRRRSAVHPAPTEPDRCHARPPRQRS